MIAAFSALIIIVVASLAKQVANGIAGPTVTNVQKLSSAPTTSASKAPTTKSSSKATTSASSSGTSAATSSPTSAPAAPVGVVQKITGATVYDPKGDGVKDNTDQTPLVFDGNQQTFWSTFQYKQQFPSTVKPGVGLMLSFGSPISPTSVTVSSDTPDTTVEIRTATGPDATYEQTTAIGSGNIATGTNAAPGTITIKLTKAPKSLYLVVFVVHMAPDNDRFKSHINEISVSGTT